MLRTIALTGLATLLAATAISVAPPAHAQIGSIFSDPLPRPPGNIPRGYKTPANKEEVPKFRQARVRQRPTGLCPGPALPPPGPGQSHPPPPHPAPPVFR